MFYNYMKSATAIAIIAATAISTSAFAAGTVMFNYQGRVKVGTTAFEGDGQFKFAILSPDKKSTLWSSDSTSVDGSEPTSGITLSVSDGVFNVLMGANGVMDPINSTVFQNRDPLKLRTWFNDGTHGFQQLEPDYNLININLITSETGSDDFTIYVNGETGDDSNSGLKPTEAKKTIQGGINILPDRVKCNVTIDIADGTYPESLSIFGMSVEPGKNVTMLGDESWTTQSISLPTVVVSGRDGATTDSPKVRDFGLRVVQSSGLRIEGLGIQGFEKDGVSIDATLLDVSSCCFSDCANGLQAAANSYVNVSDSTSKDNEANGFYCGRQSSGQFTACKALSNGEVGFRGNAFATLRFLDISLTSENQTGLLAQHKSSLIFTGKVQVTNNSNYGLFLIQDSYTENFVNGTTVQGNGHANQPYIKFGSNIYEF